MKGLRKLLIEEYLRLEKIAGKLRKELADMPEGTLRVSKSHNYTQFYNVKKENDDAVRYITIIYPVKKSADAPKFAAKFKNKTFNENGLEVEVKVNGKKQSLKYNL